MGPRDLLVQATTVPSLAAEGALAVLADLWLEEGWTGGLVTSEGHDPELARQKFLGHVFCRAWRELKSTLRQHEYPAHMAVMPNRTRSPLHSCVCWVQFRVWPLDRVAYGTQAVPQVGK